MVSQKGKLNFSQDAAFKYLGISFHLYIYSPDAQEFDRGTLHKASNYPDLLLKMPRYCCQVEIIYFIYNKTQSQYSSHHFINFDSKINKMMTMVLALCTILKLLTCSSHHVPIFTSVF